MFDVLRNILSCAGTFIVISTGSMLLLQGIVCLCTWEWHAKENTDYRIIVTGIIIALLLVPFYYLPA